MDRAQALLGSPAIIGGVSIARTAARMVCNIFSASSSSTPKKDARASKTGGGGGGAGAGGGATGGARRGAGQSESSGQGNMASGAAVLQAFQGHSHLLSRALEVLSSRPPRDYAPPPSTDDSRSLYTQAAVPLTTLATTAHLGKRGQDGMALILKSAFYSAFI
jgi:hypothetical protein